MSCGTHDGNQKCVRQCGCETSNEGIFVRLTGLTSSIIRNEPRASRNSSIYAVRQITGESAFQSQQGPNELSDSSILLSNAGSEPSPRDNEAVAEHSPPCQALCLGKFHNNLSVSSTAFAAGKMKLKGDIHIEYQTKKSI
jgi:hypothetical protein